LTISNSFVTTVATPRQPRNLDEGHGVHREHLVRLRREEEIDALLDQDLGVAREVARVPCEIVARVELRRVDEDRNGGQVGLRLHAPYQRDVPFVQRAHRGNEAHDFPRRPRCGARVAHRTRAPDDVHQS
jgi:hypothetical protein